MTKVKTKIRQLFLLSHFSHGLFILKNERCRCQCRWGKLHEVLMTNKFTRSSVDVSHGSPLTFILSKGYCSKHLTILPLGFDCFMPLPFVVSYRFFRHTIVYFPVKHVQEFNEKQ